MSTPAPNDNTLEQNSSKGRKLPFSRWWPLLIGAAVGLLLRLVFSGTPGKAYAAMLGTFTLLVPMVVGAVTVYVAERIERRSWAYCASAAAAAAALFVIGSLLIMIEGIICAILAVPLFMIMAAIGGILMGAVCRLTNWPKRALYSFAALPLLLGAIEPMLPIPQRIVTVERRVLVNASPEITWQQILAARDIQPEEVEGGWIYLIGVPLPLSGITEQSAEGLVRKVHMGKSIHFDQVATHWQANHYVHWQYRFSDDSFPPAALDDHVRIGGHYFDLMGTSYILRPHGKRTELKIQMRYRVSTQFNWYAGPLAELLIGNFGDVILDFYRRRSEAASPPS